MAAVRESGGALRSGSRGQRVLHLGFWTLFGLDKSEVKAILAHEYGHFSHGETRLTPVIGRIQATLFLMLARMASLGRWVWINPSIGTCASTCRHFSPLRRATRGARSCSPIGRRRWPTAAMHSVARCAASSSGHALRSLCGLPGWDTAQIGAAVRRVVSRDGAARAVEPPRLHEARVRQALESEPGRYDSHPPPPTGSREWPAWSGSASTTLRPPSRCLPMPRRPLTLWLSRFDPTSTRI